MTTKFNADPGPELVVTFGKYSGRTIEDIPSKYLRWLADNVEDRPDVMSAAAEELWYRSNHSGHFEEETDEQAGNRRT